MFLPPLCGDTLQGGQNQDVYVLPGRCRLLATLHVFWFSASSVCSLAHSATCIEPEIHHACWVVTGDTQAARFWSIEA